MPDVDSNQNDKWNPGPNKDIPDLQIFLELFRKTIFQGSYQGGKKQEICDYKMIIPVLPLWKEVFLYFF